MEKPDQIQMTSSLKHEEDDEENVVDRISNLPDPILELIFSRLPNTEQVIQTSILSKRWRSLWTSIPYFPSLDFDCSPSHSNLKKDKFEEFVTWALANKTDCNNLDSFRLHCSTYYNMSTLTGWIDTAIMRKVKFLDLMFPSKICHVNIVLPNSLINCDSLEALRLDLSGYLCLPKCAWFSALKVLELKNISTLQNSLIEQFFKSCPLLEDLTVLEMSIIGARRFLLISSLKLKALRIRNLYGESSVEVSCPKLDVLEYEGLSRHLSIRECRDSLKKAVIVFKDKDQNQMLANSIQSLFAEISNVEAFSLTLPSIQSSCNFDASWNPHGYRPAHLAYLKTAEITTTIDTFSMNILVRILKHSPNLKSLHLIIQKEFLRTSKYWDFDELRTRKILTRRLKRVEFLDFSGEKWSVDVARSVLEHGKALEEMIFSWRDKVKYHEMSRETMHQVSTFYKASSNVKLITRLN